MDAVRLDGSRYVDQILVDHWNEGYVMLRGQVAENLVERLDVVGSVVRRQRDARKQDLDMRGAESGEHGIQIFTRLIQGQTTQPVVATEFYDHDVRMGLCDQPDICGGVFGGRPACSAVLNLIFVAVPIKIALERFWVGLAGLEPVAGGDAVTVADDRWPLGAAQNKRSYNETQRNEKR